MKQKLILEINEKQFAEKSFSGEIAHVFLTPPIDKDYWLFRVKLSEKQAIVGFPKFSVIGIGFAEEEDWNTNLPSSESTLSIFNHIKHNKGDKKN